MKALRRPIMRGYLHLASFCDYIPRGYPGSLMVSSTIRCPAEAQQSIDLNPGQVEQALGYPRKINGCILQFSVPRIEKITEGKMEIPPPMGVATAINFQPTGQGKAAISGDFVLLASEVNPVIRAFADTWNRSRGHAQSHAV